jgi:uncharacterized protein RhaS with RHS repeats
MNRYYASGVGRFLTTDPSGQRAVDTAKPGSWNAYHYSGNDPVNFHDPTGLNQAAPDGYCGAENESCDPDNCSLYIGSEFLSVPNPACGGGGGGPIGGGGPDPDPEPKFQCPQNFTNFIVAHGKDAIATGLDEANVLALSVGESGWGGGRFATEGNSFFNLETLAPKGWNPGDPYPNTIYDKQVSWLNAKEPFESGPHAGQYSLVATYKNASDSFASFAAKDSQYLKGITDPATFGTIAAAHGIHAGRQKAFLTNEKTFAECIEAQKQ